MIMGTELLKDPITDTIARPYYAIFFLEGHEDLHVSDEDDCLNAVCHNGGKCINGINSYTCDCKEGFIGEQCEWEKQGCFKEVKNKNKKAMGKVLGKFTKYKKNIKGAVEACMKAAKGKKLEIFGVRSKFICATTRGNADYKMHGASPKGCKEEGDYGVGVKLANYVYVLKKN
ncbi:hypothetical protein pdam_00012098 [Pocillopora damicornis]|uniref:EGF-like domain-containing protein n=1 Tax=Pocillopora damicornis TaxID=46731 RepID=A0A3M6UR51_POCDA|nr:hypothetical protein pdam_00012098 [Pocillopora damicornis]